MPEVPLHGDHLPLRLCFAGPILGYKVTEGVIVLRVPWFRVFGVRHGHNGGCGPRWRHPLLGQDPLLGCRVGRGNLHSIFYFRPTTWFRTYVYVHVKIRGRERPLACFDYAVPFNAYIESPSWFV